MKIESIGGLAFLIGLLLAAGIAIFSAASPPVWAVAAMAGLGVIVGLLNIKDKEAIVFMISSLVFLVSFNALSDVFTALTFGWAGMSTFFQLMSVFVAPAAAVVATITLYHMAKD